MCNVLPGEHIVMAFMGAGTPFPFKLKKAAPPLGFQGWARQKSLARDFDGDVERRRPLHHRDRSGKPKSQAGWDSGRARPFGLGGGVFQKEQIPLRFARRNDNGFGKNSGEIIGDGTERFPVFRRMEIGERRVRSRFFSPDFAQTPIRYLRIG
jgi:hypothetical protein